MRAKVLWPFKALGALIAALIFWEIVLRAAIIRPVQYHASPVLGWMPVPYAQGLHSGEGFSTLKFNALGFRDAEIEPKAAGETRILMLGDSFTEGRQVDIESTFVRRLNAALTSCSVRVMNGGRDGASPAYSLYFATEYHRLFAPDWVVLIVRDGNWAQELEASKEVSLRPASDGFQYQVRFQKERGGRVATAVDDLGVLPSYARIRLSLLRGAAQDDYRKGGQNTSSRDELELQKRAMKWTLSHLQEKFPRLVIVHMPYGSTEAGGLVPPQPLEKELGEFCAAQKIAFIPMRGAIEADFKRAHQPPYGFSNTLPWTGHPNGHGHQLIAHELEKFFRPRLCDSSSTSAAK